MTKHDMQRRIEDLEEALGPFALFASACKNMKPHWPVVTYGHQELRVSCFLEAQAMFPKLQKLHT